MGYDRGMDKTERCEPMYEIQDQEAVEAACRSMPETAILERLADFYKVMGDPTRLRLLIALEQKELCVSDLSSLVGMSRSAISHQLRALKSAKLVKSRKDGKAVYYSLDDEHIHSVIKVALAHILEED
ncbi:ArsR/SmtB family transcription factor [Allobaculum mucilyticum]|uniref:ArsR/SmtB family transcription factor n=1 Tax=Allobaculum mucilyticum TaxID=2834459 RepID=UPI001E60B9F1|nr:metalloregulator ArsR/SmtB family transcription factor [Allobaculum mucilyticum]UNT95617.1 metalloregulator ArsR/SmtB family transcription factor [Allobaculum mucilyticum]